MLQSRFEEHQEIPTDAPVVLVQAASKDRRIEQLLAYLDHYNAPAPAIIPVKSDDRIMMIRPDTIILADVVEGQLVLTTTTAVISTKEALSHFQKRVASPDLVQVSKHAVLNLNHLLSLSDSFSGNMAAKLSHNLKTEVSRKFVKTLMRSLGV
jgi:DNA-binding LytR/AlgR family response regulator